MSDFFGRMKVDLKERIELTRQTLDALERIEANEGKVPDGFVLEYYDEPDRSWRWSALNSGSGQRFVMHYRLRSAAPRKVPLGPEDIPPLSVVRDKDWDSWKWCYVVPDDDCVKVSATRTVGYTALMNGWEIQRPGEDWKPCSKDAPN